MYDGLSNDYDIPITASTSSSSSDHDYDIPQGSGKKKINFQVKYSAVTSDKFVCLF